MYLVRYLDKDGNEHLTHCKTSLWTGVYFSQDRIITNAEKPALPVVHYEYALETENRRLREEVEQLQRQLVSIQPLPSPASVNENEQP